MLHLGGENYLDRNLGHLGFQATTVAIGS